uniref:Uncharacterized protein n=1 Tax=Acrobeloides nanus TaxID=290746 RepID=A0A914E174_9BILA
MDLYTKIPGINVDNSNADVSCDSYHKYKEDVQMLKFLGVQQYRMSLSWSRILPDGTLKNINQSGIDYYNNLINELVTNNIEPLVNLYFWDLPQSLMDLGGFLNPKIIDWFGDYARLCFSKFGDRAKVKLNAK